MAFSLGDLWNSATGAITNGINTTIQGAQAILSNLPAPHSIDTAVNNLATQLYQDIIPPPITNKPSLQPVQPVPAPFSIPFIQNSSIPLNTTPTPSIPRSTITSTTNPTLTTVIQRAPLINASSPITSQTPPSALQQSPIVPKFLSSFPAFQQTLPNPTSGQGFLTQLGIANPQPVRVIQPTVADATTPAIQKGINTVSSINNQPPGVQTAITLGSLLTGAKTLLPSTTSGLMTDLGLVGGAVAPEVGLIGKALLAGGGLAVGGQIAKGFLGGGKKKRVHHRRMTRMRTYRGTTRRGHRGGGLTVHGKHFKSQRHKMAYLRSLRKR